jgi:hypothetical protein
VSTAIIDPTGRFRYSLTRSWEPGQPLAVFVMINPSTADHTVNDPTIVRCIGFAKREGFGGMIVVNAYALRSTDPVNVRRDPGAAIGPRNDGMIRLAASDADRTGGRIIVAWGPKTWARSRTRYVAHNLLADWPLWCLGVAKDGSPRHPLMVRTEQPLTRWAR